MSYTVDSPIIGKPSGTLAEALAWMDIKAGPETEYAIELWRLSGLVGFDPAILFAHAAHETGDFSSFWWETRRNPAGIGITGDPAQNEASQTWATGTDAARAHVAHMIAYTYQSLPWPEGAGGAGPNWTGDNGRVEQYLRTQPLYTADTRFYHAVREIAGRAAVLADLTSQWATDPRYAQKIAAKANVIFPARQEQKPMSTFTPKIYRLWEDYEVFGLTRDEAFRLMAKCFLNRQQGGVQGHPTHIVFHIQAGNTRGSLRYWLDRDASSTVMVQHDGSILQVIPEEHGPWTNGDDYAPKTAGKALVDQPGNSNIWTLSLEYEGLSGSDVTDIQIEAGIWQAQQWMAKYPDTALPGHVLEHADVQQIQKPNCAGAYFQIVKARLAEIPAPTIPQFAKPGPTPFERGDVGFYDFNGNRALAKTCEVKCIKTAVPRARVGAGAPRSRENYIKGETAVSIAEFKSGGIRYRILEGGHRVRGSSFVETRM